MKILLQPLLILLFLAHMAHAQQPRAFLIEGSISLLPEKSPAIGASVVVKGTNYGAVADLDGRFNLSLAPGNYTLLVSSIGYLTQEIPLSVPLANAEMLTLQLSPDQISLQGVEVVSTGYQEIPKERATGSFVQVDNKLVNRRISSNILDRLEDITPSLIFNRDRPDLENNISIRGTATIFSDTRPLIVIDNFPYDGPIENINPNDVESITVLRDAAAASIWGARAGNGVIIITTKKGIKGAAPKVSLVSNMTLVEERDLFYDRNMSIPTFIEAETALFNRGQFRSRENNNSKPILSPVVETLIQQRNGTITPEEAERIISGFAGGDLRKDLEKYYFQPEFRQQYSLGIRGGAEVHSYAVFAGMDANREGVVENHNNRFTLNVQNNFSLISDKLTIGSGVYFANSNRTSGASAPSSFYPYEMLADGEGNHLPLVFGYNTRFTSSAEGRGLLNWDYVPLDEIGLSSLTNAENDVRINTSIAYKMTPALKAEVLHQYWANSSRTENLFGRESFFSRDLTNLFSVINPDASVTRNIPLGAIRDLNTSAASSNYLRAQLQYNEDMGPRSFFSALLGAEVKDLSINGTGNRLYGYDPEFGTSMPVDYVTRFRRFHNNSFANIPRQDRVTGTVSRFISYYTNMAYTLDKKYTVSVSARQDGSNIFGVNSNQRLVPLWSSGLSWTLSEEGFYNWGAMPFIKLKATYGYNGNVNSALSAYPTAFYRQGSMISNLRYLALNSPGNPDLRWERIRIINFGLDFESKDAVLAGNIEFFVKNGQDLIGTIPFASSAGVFDFTGNFADTRTHGLDIALNSKNINRKFIWNSALIFTTIKEEVTDYKGEFFITQFLDYGSGGMGIAPSPLEGYPLFSVFSLPYAGLDPDTGAPVGFLDGEPSMDYNGIISNTKPEDLIFMGSGRPTVFGAIRNDFHLGNFSLSANISYRLGYVFRRPTVNYANLLNGFTTHRDYENRWQNPGDELITDVPSLPAANNANRETLYRNSPSLIEKGDHFRFQDIRFSYSLGSENPRLRKIGSAEIFLYVNNIGILWKATDLDIDPDFRTVRPPASFSLGIHLGL